MSRILFVDDEKIHIDMYRTELELLGIESTLVAGPDECLAHLSQVGAPDLFVLDVMMAPGRALSHVNTEDGLRTGVVLSHVLRQLYPLIPIVLFTNVAHDPLLTTVRRGAHSVGDVLLLYKHKTLPDEFFEIVQRLLAGDTVDIVARRKSVGQCVLDALILQPAVAGLGVDVKTLVRGLRDRLTNK